MAVYNRTMVERKHLLAVGLVILAVGAGIWYTQFRCDDDLAIDGPNAELSFQRDAAAGTLTITHTGGAPLIDANNRTRWGCREEFEPDEVLIVVIQNTSTQRSQQYLWLARNGSGVGTLPLKKGASATLVEPDADGSGDIHLQTPLEHGDVVRVIGRSEQGSSATFGRYVVSDNE